MPEGVKRKAEVPSVGTTKRAKYCKFKSTNKGDDNLLTSSTTIEPGSSGIWATCVRGLEAKSTGQLRDLLEEYATKLYPELSSGSIEADGKGREANKDDEGDEDEVDIEAAIKSELKNAKEASKQQLFKTVRIDAACVLYFKVEPLIDPVALVRRICSDAAAGETQKQTRHINRLTPMTLMGKATLRSLETIAKQILAPHFHQSDESKKFAIRPTIRNNEDLKRQEVIEKVAEIVGNGHKVDLGKPDLVILVSVYKNMCGMSVVDGDYERLKRYNLNELYNSAPLRDAKSSDATEEGQALESK